MKTLVKKIVNKRYSCGKCSERDYCQFWGGSNISFDCGECTADEFAQGVYATFEYLSKIPWNEAIDVICKYNEDCDERYRPL